MSDKVMKLNMSKMGLTIGTYWGVSLFVLSLMGMFLHVGGDVIALFATLYVGYAATFVGALIGFVLGFIHGYVVGFIGSYLMKFVAR